MSPRGDGMFWAGSIEQSGYHARVQERWVPILLSVGYNNSVKIYAETRPVPRSHVRRGAIRERRNGAP